MIGPELLFLFLIYVEFERKKMKSGKNAHRIFLVANAHSFVPYYIYVRKYTAKSRMSKKKFVPRVSAWSLPWKIKGSEEMLVSISKQN